jgi:hypothetical protein
MTARVSAVKPKIKKSNLVGWGLPREEVQNERPDPRPLTLLRTVKQNHVGKNAPQRLNHSAKFFFFFLH